MDIILIVMLIMLIFVDIILIIMDILLIFVDIVLINMDIILIYLHKIKIRQCGDGFHLPNKKPLLLGSGFLPIKKQKSYN